MNLDAPDQLTLEEARRKIGLSPRDPLAGYLEQWREVETQLVRLANREQDAKQLAVYERDLASLRQVIVTLERDDAPPKSSHGIVIWAVCTGILIALLTIAWFQWGRGFDVDQHVSDLSSLKKATIQAVEKRRWSEAEDLVRQLRQRGVGKTWARSVQAKIAQEKQEENGQQLGYFIGQAQAALEAGRIEEAADLLREIATRAPDDARVVELTRKIETGKTEARIKRLVDGIDKAIMQRKWASAEGQLADLERVAPQHPQLSPFRVKLQKERAQYEENRQEAQKLYRKALALDQGTYSNEALDLLEEALRLDASEDIRRLYQKMAAYGRVIRVPQDVPNLIDALEKARSRDRILLDEGTFTGSFVIPSGIELVGSGPEVTILECAAEKGPVVSLSEAGLPTRLALLKVRHHGLSSEEERFPGIAVRQGLLKLEDVIVTGAAGHGVAVMETGRLQFTRGEVSRCGWDGISVRGASASAAVAQVLSQDHLHHGIDFWEGGSGKVISCQLQGNGRAGLVALSPAAELEIRATQIRKNRELGMLISDATGALISGCAIVENSLGGVVFQEGSKQCRLEGSVVSQNREAGVVVERGSDVKITADNSVTENLGRQIWQDAVFPTIPTEDFTPPPVPAPER